MLFINMSNTRMEDGSVINILTLIFNYDATMELERHLKSLAETWYFWSKVLHPREIPFQHNDGTDALDEIILACNEDKTWDPNCSLAGLRELARTGFGDLRGVQLTWFNKWVPSCQDDPKVATEVLDSFQNRLYGLRGMGDITWLPGMAKVSKFVVRDTQQKTIVTLPNIGFCEVDLLKGLSRGCT